jgi:MerR family transcriptional regulator, copper efflux regulator
MGAPAGRTAGGFRLCTDCEVDLLLLIKQMKPLGFTVQEMRELLGAHDALDSEDKGERRAAEGRIAAFARRAAERWEELREQLSRAEELARRLAAHAAHAAGRGRPRAR